MQTRLWNVALVLALSSASVSCTSKDSTSDAGSPAGAHAVLQTIGAQFQRVEPPAVDPRDVPQTRPFFSEPWKASFEVDVDGSLSARAPQEAAPALPSGLLRGEGFNLATASARNKEQ